MLICRSLKLVTKYSLDQFGNKLVCPVNPEKLIPQHPVFLGNPINVRPKILVQYVGCA